MKDQKSQDLHSQLQALKQGYRYVSAPGDTDIQFSAENSVDKSDAPDHISSETFYKLRMTCDVKEGHRAPMQ